MQNDPCQATVGSYRLGQISAVSSLYHTLFDVIRADFFGPLFALLTLEILKLEVRVKIL